MLISAIPRNIEGTAAKRAKLPSICVASLATLTLLVASQGMHGCRTASASERYPPRLFNMWYGYTAKYYGHEPSGYVWPIHNARFPYAAQYYLNLPVQRQHPPHLRRPQNEFGWLAPEGGDHEPLPPPMEMPVDEWFPDKVQ